MEWSGSRVGLGMRVCLHVSTESPEPVWVREWLVRCCQNEKADLAGDEHVSAPDGCGTQMGDTVSVSSSS